MKAGLGRYVHTTSEEMLEFGGGVEGTESKLRGLGAVELDEQVHIALVRGLSTSHGPEDPDLSHMMAAGDLLDLYTIRLQDLWDSVSPAPTRNTELRLVPVF